MPHRPHPLLHPKLDVRAADFLTTLSAAGALAAMALFHQFFGDDQGRVVAQVLGPLALWTLGSAFFNRRASPLAGGRLRLVNAFACGAALIASAWVSSGQASPYFGYAYALPMAFGVLQPKQPWLGALSAAGAAITAVWLFGPVMDAAALATAVMLMGISGAFSGLGTTVYQRLSRAEQDSAVAREEALTRLAANERAMAAQERFATVGRLAAGVAHEINNPLAFVKANIGFVAEELARGANDRQELLAVLEETQVGVSRIARIVADLKTLSREQTQASEVIDVPALVVEAVRMAGVQLLGIATIEVEPMSATHEVRGVSGRVLQVLLNLLLNAGDALAGRPPPGLIRISLESVADGCLLHVDDNGPGVLDEYRERIFEPFFTTKPVGAGTGMGLSVSRSYVEEFGGKLSLATSPLGGARFTISVPTSSPKRA